MKNAIRLLTSLLADSALTVVSVGMWPFMFKDDTFTQRELRHQRQIETLKILLSEKIDSGDKKATGNG